MIFNIENLRHLQELWRDIPRAVQVQHPELKSLVVVTPDENGAHVPVFSSQGGYRVSCPQEGPWFEKLEHAEVFAACKSYEDQHGVPDSPSDFGEAAI